jgi:hypothetical protein
MILYRFQVFDDEGNIPIAPKIGLDTIMDAKDIEEFCSFYPEFTFKVTTLVDSKEIDRARLEGYHLGYSQAYMDHEDGGKYKDTADEKHLKDMQHIRDLNNASWTKF